MVRSWPGRAEAVLRFVAGKLSFSYTLRQKIGAQVDRPLVADGWSPRAAASWSLNWGCGLPPGQ